VHRRLIDDGVVFEVDFDKFINYKFLKFVEEGHVMALVKVRQNYQITIPAEVRKNMKVGDYLEVERKNGELVLKEVKMVHSDQAYFYSKEWQEAEAEADSEIASGETVGPFDGIDDALNALKKAKT